MLTTKLDFADTQFLLISLAKLHKWPLSQNWNYLNQKRTMDVTYNATRFHFVFVDFRAAMSKIGQLGSHLLATEFRERKKKHKSQNKMIKQWWRDYAERYTTGVLSGEKLWHLASMESVRY